MQAQLGADELRDGNEGGLEKLHMRRAIPGCHSRVLHPEPAGVQAQMGADELRDGDEGALEQLPTPQELSADLHAIEEAVAAIEADERAQLLQPWTHTPLPGKRACDHPRGLLGRMQLCQPGRPRGLPCKQMVAASRLTSAPNCCSPGRTCPCQASGPHCQPFTACAAACASASLASNAACHARRHTPQLSPSSATGCCSP